MNQTYHSYTSNRLELLYRHLKERLFAETSTPFTRRLIVVSSPQMKSWIMLRMANDPEMGIAMGLEISYLDQTIELLKQHSTTERAPSLKPLELALLIETELYQLLASSQSLSSAEKEVWKPLFEYLKFQSTINNKIAKRITLLSETLSQLFLKYGIYGGSLLEQWRENHSPQWQQKLWLKIYETTNRRNYPYRELNEISIPQMLDTQIHLFGLNFIPHVYHQFFLKVSQVIPLSFYRLSPCHAFWSDTLSDKESYRLKKYWKKRGVNFQQQRDLDILLRDRNPLLANFGKVGRVMAERFDEEALSTHCYVLPESLKEFSQYEDLLDEEVILEHSQKPLSLLEAVQADCVLLRTPNSSQKIDFAERDRSIQIASASTRRREVEILYDRLLEIIVKHQNTSDPILPQDILVMAPDINLYAPHIAALFSNAESCLEAQIIDRPMTSQNQIIQVFQKLIDLPFSRWEASTLVDLFESGAFQRKQKLTHEDAQQIKEWIKVTGVRWGENQNHRNEILNRTFCASPMSESNQAGTWEHAQELLLESLLFNDKKYTVDITEAELLGKWILLLRSLRDDLNDLSNGSKRTLGQWSGYLKNLAQKYLEKSHDSEEEFLELLSLLNVFSQAENKIGTSFFTFASIKQHLQKVFSKSSTAYSEQSLHAIRFSSFLPMRCIPAKVIAVLGMDEEAFPRKDDFLSLDLLKNEASDYCPSDSEYDRYLFLETLLSTKKYFLLSYQGYQPIDGRKSSPSLLITELLSYLDGNYTISGKKPSQLCVEEHPFHAFDEVYFKKESGLTTFSNKNFELAKAYYHRHTLVREQEILKSPQERATLSQTITIQELVNFASNPIKSYFNKTLKIYLDDPESRIFKSNELFEFNALHHHIIKKDSSYMSVDDVLKNAESNGLLPSGLFKKTAIDKIKDEIEKLQNNLRDLGIMPQQFFSLTFSESCQTARKEGQNWILPVLFCKLDNDEIPITGTLTQVTSQGLISTYKDDKKHLSKILPEFLILQMAIDKYHLPISPNLLLANSLKANLKMPFLNRPEEHLTEYLRYYHLGLENLSPLLPEWIPHVLDNNENRLLEIVNDSQNNPFHQIQNRYLMWSLQKNLLPKAEDIVTRWKPIAERLFKPMFESWS